MQLLKTLGGIFGFGNKVRTIYFDPLNAQREALKAIQQYDIFPETTGNYSARIYRKMVREDSHVAGLYRRIIFALLSAKIIFTCEDKAVEELLHRHLGYDPDKPSYRFSKLLKEVASSILYGFCVHEKRIHNDMDTGETMLGLRYIQPVDIYEFTINGDGELLSVSESYSETIHGIDKERKRISDGNVDVAVLPADTLFHIAPMQEGYNYWGESILEPAIPDWVLKRIYRFANAVLQGRFSVPIPVGKTDVDRTKNTQIIAGQLNMPATDPNRLLVIDNESDIDLKTVSNTTDIIASINYCDFSISKLLLEQFVDIGDKRYGSRNTSEDAVQEFHTSLNYFEMVFIENLSRIAEEIRMLNFGEDNDAPITIQWEDLEFRGRRELIKLYDQLVKQQTISKQVADEIYIRDSMGLPPLDEETIKMLIEMREAEMRMDPDRNPMDPGVAETDDEESMDPDDASRPGPRPGEM